jgi:hypothetical protein
MTRRSKLALVALLAGLLSLVPVTTVSADTDCTGYAQEHCEEMVAANDAILFRITEVASPVHLLGANGMGQEHFEAMSMAQPALFQIALSDTVATNLSIYAPEHHEEIMAAAEAGN